MRRPSSWCRRPCPRSSRPCRASPVARAPGAPPPIRTPPTERVLLPSCLLHLNKGSFNLDLEDRYRLALALDDDVAERAHVVGSRQPGPGGVADDNPGLVILVQRFQPGPQVHVVA